MPACMFAMCVGISKVMKCAICFLSFSPVAALMEDFYLSLQDELAANRCNYWHEGLQEKLILEKMLEHY